MDAVVGRFLERRARLDGQKTAIICSGRRLTFAEFDALVAQMAGLLAAKGIERGDRLAVLMKNGMASCALYHAAARLGAVLCPINWRLAGPEIAFILEHSEARLLIFDAEFSPAIEALPDLPALEQRLSFGEDGEVPPDPPAHEPFTDPCPAAPDDPLLLVYTSGTTGRPKGAVLTQAQMAWSSLTMATTLDYRRSDVGLIPVPLFHVGGLSFATLFVHVGATAVLMPAWEADIALALIDREGINHFFAVAAMLEGLAQAPDYDSADLGSLRWIMSGGAPVPVELIHRFAERGIPVIQTYGSTETAGPAVVVDIANAAAKAGAAGLPFFHTDIRIIDENGAPLPPDQPGEVQIRAPHVTSGYWRDDEATARAFDGDWFRSGDIGRLDADGYLHILDRKKDMIVSGGENIYPAEVERVLASHPAVAEVAIIGAPDPRWGETVCAVVFPAPGGAPTLEALIEHCRHDLARYKHPRKLVIRDAAMPRNATGKILKHELRRAPGG
ncbi:MAG: long-chain fatty acid--CoA ligase [Alphaproteobacteria bacterium]|nr:long-chain fatty acid--CoA ligase [Alphaproteobacteria bacterium]